MWAEYCDRGYTFDRDFTYSDKPRWLIIGNSFGRDFINIILESEIRDNVEISYISSIQDSSKINRIQNADVVFISTLGLEDELVNAVQSNMSEDQNLTIVGEKNFGYNNGQVFSKRYSPGYLKETVFMEKGYEERNTANRTKYADRFLDLIEIVKQSDGKVRVFSDDGYFISQDCRHLTRAGAEFYAKNIDWTRFKISR